MDDFEINNRILLELIDEWIPVLFSIPEEVVLNRRNNQNRTIKQIVGHLVDSASNNTHRIIHMQYQSSPLIFPDYATHGNNDRWIAIQNYQAENWSDLIYHWKYSHLHLIHVIRNVNRKGLDNEWISGTGEKIALRIMISDYLRHFKLHMGEISALINSDKN